MKLIIPLFLTTGLALAGVVSSVAGPAAPSVVYSTYLGSDADEQGRSVAMDNAGRAYVTGYTSSAVFPAGSGRTPDHGVDVYAVRFDPTGSNAEYLYWFNALTLYAEDEGYSIAADAQGNAYVTGYTRSQDFCTVFGAVPGYHPTYYGETDAFVLKIKADGSGLAYCTFLGGSDWDSGRAIAVDREGNVWVAGGTWSTDFPTTADALQGSPAGLRDVFLAKLDASGTVLDYSTYLGGSGQEEGVALAITPGSGVAEDKVVVAGWTNSADFPVTAGVIGPAYQGNTDGFLFRITPGAAAPNYATYLGGSGDDRPTGLAAGEAATALVVGYTESPNFPTTPDALAGEPLGGVDGFAVKVNGGGDALAWGTYIGGSGDDHVWDVGGDRAIDLAGETTSIDLPVTSSAFNSSLNGPSDAFLLRLANNGRRVDFATYLGGSGADRAYSVATTADGTVLTGMTQSADFPTTPGAYETTYNGSGDIFVTTLNLDTSGSTHPRMWLPLVRRF